MAQALYRISFIPMLRKVQVPGGRKRPISENLLQNLVATLVGPFYHILPVVPVMMI